MIQFDEHIFFHWLEPPTRVIYKRGEITPTSRGPNNPGKPIDNAISQALQNPVTHLSGLVLQIDRRALGVAVARPPRFMPWFWHTKQGCATGGEQLSDGWIVK